MTDEAKQVVETIKQAFSVFADMELPMEEHVCMLSHDAAMTLINELERVERERDVAVEDLKQAAIYLCCACRKYHRAIPGKSHHYCEEIGKREDFEGAIACGMFEWRGVKED